MAAMARYAFVLAFASHLWAGLSTGAVAADPEFPALSGRVVDAANIIPADRRANIETKLADFETKTTDQVVVATVPGLGDLTVEDYANRLFRHWGIGQKAKNNGVLLLIAPTEHKMRVEVGYGLEGTLTDAASSTIINTVIGPKFRKGDFAGGVEAGVDQILAILGSDAASGKASQPAAYIDYTPADIRRQHIEQLMPLAIFAVAFAFIFWPRRAKRAPSSFAARQMDEQRIELRLLFWHKPMGFVLLDLGIFRGKFIKRELVRRELFRWGFLRG
jgi:uncharacterized membrane protein YgcG